MIIKPSPIHSGWSYETGDDQYEEGSLGSTTDTKEWKQSTEKPENGAKNTFVQIIGSNNKTVQHDEGNWTTIGKKKNRRKNRNNTNDNQRKNNTNKATDTIKARKTSSETIEHEVKQVRFVDEHATEELKQILGIRSKEYKIIGQGQPTTRTTGNEETNKNNSASNMEEDKRSKENEQNNDKESNRNNEDKDMEPNKTTGNDNDDKNDKNKEDRNNNNGKKKVTLVDETNMEIYTFTIAWQPKKKAGKDGKTIVRMLLRAIQNKAPGTIFHPTNSSTSPVPRDILSINGDFPNSPAEFDDFFDQSRNKDNTNYSIYMKATMPHDEKTLKKKLSNYLYHEQLYMNSPFIDDSTLEQVGFIENGHSRLVWRPDIQEKIKNGIKEIIEVGDLSPQQRAQLKNLSNPVRIECFNGTFKAGSHQNPVTCEGVILKSAKSQAKLVMELLSMLPTNLLGEYYRVIPKSLNVLLGYEMYGDIVTDTVNFQNQLRPLTIMNCHHSIFEDKYDKLKTEKSTHVKVRQFITNIGAISIEKTGETATKGKYIIIIPMDKAEKAREAIGTMFQEFQRESGRPAALACLENYNNFPTVNDTVTISGHAQKLADQIRKKYGNRSKRTPSSHSVATPYSFHGDQFTQTSTPAKVPTSIIRNNRQNTLTQTPKKNREDKRQQMQGQYLHAAQSQYQPHTPQQGDNKTIGTEVSGLSPDDSAKTMMTNVSKLVVNLGDMVTTLAKESASTNDTLKQMMLQQSSTMNNFMALMARNEDSRNEERRLEERRYDGTQRVPQNIVQLSSTPASSTLTCSQNSLSQIQPIAKRSRTEIDDETTAASTSTILNTQQQGNNNKERDDEVMGEDEQQEEVQEAHRLEDTNKIRPRVQQEQIGNNNMEIERQEATNNFVEGDFDQQFRKDSNESKRNVE